MLRKFSLSNVASLLLAVAVVGMLSACAGTKSAYQAAAESPNALEAKAFVVSEHYAALVREANDLADQPNIPREVVTRMQAVDARARPLVLQLRTAAQAYAAVKSAENAAALQTALNAAVVEVSAFITVLRNR